MLGAAFQLDPVARDEEMMRVTRQDRGIWGNLYQVAWEKQPAAAGKTLDIVFSKMFAGMRHSTVAPKGDKVLRAMPFSSSCSAGLVYVVDGDYRNSYISWLEGFPDAPHDDHADASAGAHEMLTSKNWWIS